MSNSIVEHTNKEALGSANTQLITRFHQLSGKLNQLKQYNPRDIFLLTQTAAEQTRWVQKALKTYGRITFYNSRSIPTEILGIKAIKNGRILVQCRFSGRRAVFNKSPYLETMLKEGTKFVPNLAVTVGDYAETLKKEIDKIVDIINHENTVIDKKYLAEINKLTKIEQEATTEKTHLTSGVTGLKKTPVDKILTKEEEKILITWICDNIDVIHLYCLRDGRSESILKGAGISAENYLARTAAHNSAGEIISTDAIAGEVDFKNIGGAPEELLRKICSCKHSIELFKAGRRLCDVNLAMYLLITYAQYGFVGQTRNLNTRINTSALLVDNFT